jgi:hypothetical protein
MTTIAMTTTDYAALTDAHEHCMRAIAAARASRPDSGDALVALEAVADQLRTSLRVLEALKQRARVHA